MQIGKHVTACIKEADMFKTEAMKVQLANLYAHIFLFLQDVMKWYMKKSQRRFLDAFRGDFYDEFKEQIEGILEMSREIKRESDIGSKAEIRSIRLFSEEMSEKFARFSAEMADIRVGMEGSSRDWAELKQTIRYTEQANERFRLAQAKSKQDQPDQIEYMVEIFSQILASANTKSLLNSRGREFYEERASAGSQRMRCKV